MPNAIIHFGVDEYYIEVDGQPSEKTDYGDPVILVVGKNRYLSLIEERDRTRLSMLGPQSHIVRLGADQPCTFETYVESILEEEDDGEEEISEAVGEEEEDGDGEEEGEEITVEESEEEDDGMPEAPLDTEEEEDD